MAQPPYGTYPSSVTYPGPYCWPGVWDLSASTPDPALYGVTVINGRPVLVQCRPNT